MRLQRLCLTLLGLFLLAPASKASIVFDTKSTAVQTITSDLVPNGSIILSAAGTQQFTLDLATGFANVTSDFKGSDFVTPLGTATYDLYNTATTGAVTDNGGSFTIRYTLLFELKITSGPLDGVIFETQTDSIFETTVASIPFPSNTVFGDPARPNDGVTIFVKDDPNGVLAALGIPVGSAVGTSSNRVVTAQYVIPEPASLSMLGLGVAGLAGYARRQRSK